MDPWLKDHLVCPRTHEPLEWHEDRLVAPAGHEYPILDGIPVMLLEEAQATNPVRFETTRQQLAQPRSLPPEPELRGDEVDPYVRDEIVATCGFLYGPVLHKVTRYPIPQLPMPDGEGRRLLDIGCGWGRWSIAAARRGYRPVGIDPSIDRARAARRITRQLGLDAIFLVADGRYLPFARASFPRVYSYSVLQHMSRGDVGLILSEIHRVLTPDDGECLIQMATRWGVRNLVNQLRQRLRPPSPFMVRYWPRRELVRTFTRLVGPTELAVDGFFTVNPQMTDLDILPWRMRAIVRTSAALRRLSERHPWLGGLADSVYVRSARGADATSGLS